MILQFDDGCALGVYSDELLDVYESLGAARVARASHVEPALGGWTADMAPVGGPVLGPFAKHCEAIAAERAWLDEHLTDLPFPGDA